MQARANNRRASREPHNERISPRSNYHRGSVINEHNIHAGVREDAVETVAGADNFLLPKTQKVIREGGRDRRLPIVRKDNLAMSIKARHVTLRYPSAFYC